MHLLKSECFNQFAEVANFAKFAILQSSSMKKPGETGQDHYIRLTGIRIANAVVNFFISC
jgi:hypothetical protein